MLSNSLPIDTRSTAPVIDQLQRHAGELGRLVRAHQSLSQQSQRRAPRLRIDALPHLMIIKIGFEPPATHRLAANIDKPNIDGPC
jgi:hypothetical protein